MGFLVLEVQVEEVLRRKIAQAAVEAFAVVKARQVIDESNLGDLLGGEGTALVEKFAFEGGEAVILPRF